MDEATKDWEVFLNPVKKGKEWEVNIGSLMEKFMTGMQRLSSREFCRKISLI